MLPFITLNRIVQDKFIPLSASFELTWNCNLRCLHCYQFPPHHRKKEELSYNEIKNILDQLAEHKTLFLALTGGEPLLRKDFWKIATYAKKKAFAISLQTNGTLINSEVAKKMRDTGFLQVHVSFLGASSATHDRITGAAGSFKAVLKAIDCLKSNGITVVLKTSLIKENFKELINMIEIAKQLNIKHVVSPIIFPKNDGGTDPIRLRLTNKQIHSFYSQIFNSQHPAKRELSDEKPFLLCAFGICECNINPVGEVYPCVSMPVSVGSLREKSFSEIWRLSPLLKQIRKLNHSELKGCLNCNYASFCFRCPGLSFLEDGSITAPSREACREAMLLKEVILDEKAKV